MLTAASLRCRSLILISAVSLSLLLPLLIWLGVLRLEVPGQHWFYHAVYNPRPFLLLPLAFLAAHVGLLAACLSGRLTGRSHWLVLSACVTCAALSVGVRASSAMGFTTLAVTIIHDGANSYFLTAVEEPDVLALARDYPRRMPGLRLHAATQSPGAVLLHAGLRRLVLNSPGLLAFVDALLWLHPCHRTGEVAVELWKMLQLRIPEQDIGAAVVISLLFPLIMSLGVLPLYALAREVAGERAAFVAISLFAVTPSFIWFSSSIDQIYVPLALTVIWLLGLRGRVAWWRLVIAGLLAGLTVFLNLGFSLLVGLAALLLVAQSCLKMATLKEGLLRAAVFVAMALVAVAAISVAFGVNVPAVVAVSAGLRRELYLNLHRGYLTWFLLNPVEFAIGGGFSLTALSLAALWCWRRLTKPAVALWVALVVGLLGLNLLGQVRAESSRMLMFVMPLLLVGSAPLIRRLRLERPLPALLLVLAQTAYAIVGFHLFDVWGNWVIPFR